MGEVSPFIFIKDMPQMTSVMNKHAFESANVQKFIHSTDLHFDVIINEEFFGDSYLMFAHKFKAPIITICERRSSIELDIALRNLSRSVVIEVKYLCSITLFLFFCRSVRYYKLCWPSKGPSASSKHSSTLGNSIRIEWIKCGSVLFTFNFTSRCCPIRIIWHFLRGFTTQCSVFTIGLCESIYTFP